MSDKPALKETIGFLKQTKEGRKYLIKQVNIQDEVNWQHNETPYSIVDKMIEKTSVLNKRILVMFNIEFLEQLIHVYNVSPGDIYFFADTELERNFAKSVYGVTSVWGDASVMKTDNGLSTRIFEMGRKTFDLVFSNPPYNGNVDLKILQALKPNVNEMIVVHPSTWLIDLKGKAKLYTDFKEDLKLKSVELFNANEIFSIDLMVPCMITHIDTNHNGNISVSLENDSFKVTNMNDITKFGKHWQYIVKPFRNVVHEYISQNSSLRANQTSTQNIDSKMVYAQLVSVMGGSVKGKNKLLDKMYSLTMKSYDGNKGIRKVSVSDTDKRTHPTFSFISEIQRDNFLKYCQTDFVRFCLALLKVNGNIDCGELELVPYMDFTQEWNDKKLFTFFDIDQETQDYIRAFLPDCHGIRVQSKELV